MSPIADEKDYEPVGASTTVVVVGAGPAGLMLAYGTHFPFSKIYSLTNLKDKLGTIRNFRRHSR